MFPSYVISSQYAAKKVLTTDGRTLVGIVSAGAAGEKSFCNRRARRFR